MSNSLMSRFANGIILLTPSRFIRQNNAKSLFKIVIFCKRSYVRCHINLVQGFHLMLYLTSHFVFVKYWKNADLYIIKPPSLSSTRNYDDEPEGTLFS